MDREMEWNAEVTKIHHINYVRNSRAITVAWFVFSACYTILNIVAFIQPFWFGDTTQSPGVGYFGLFEWCERIQGSEYSCTGNFLDFNTLMNDYFRASSFLVGGAALLFIFSIICMLLFLFLKPALVLKICGWLQLIAAVFMAVACIIYPNAFDDDNVRRICGQDAMAYNMDKCQIRWAYILGIVLIFDALILAVLAFVLAVRQAKMLPEFKKLKEEHLRYIHEWRDDVPEKNGYKNNFDTVQIQKQQQQQAIRQRHIYTSLKLNQKKSTNFDEPVFVTIMSNAGLEPINLPDQSPSNSNPNSPRSDVDPLSSRSQTSDNQEEQRSPRSDGSLGLDLESSPRSESSNEPVNYDNALEGDVHF